MTKKSCLVIVKAPGRDAYVVHPTNGENYFSMKEAQRMATAHQQHLDAEYALVVRVEATVNRPVQRQSGLSAHYPLP